MTTTGDLPEVVSRDEWLAARKDLLAKEKELTRARDQVNADRRRLPMVRIDKPYTFDGPDGEVSLPDLFEGRPQLIVHHFMWSYDIDADGVEHPRDIGCTSCSCAADRIGELRQLHVRTTTLVAVTRAPYAKLAAFRDLLHLRAWHRGVPLRDPLPRPHRARPSGAVGAAEGPCGPTRPARRRPPLALPRRVRHLTPRPDPPGARIVGATKSGDSWGTQRPLR